MKKQKKWGKTGFLLLIAGMLFLMGCQKEQAENPVREENSEIAENVENANNAEQQEQPQETLETPVLALEYLESNRYAEDGEQLLVSGSCELPTVQPVDGRETHPELRMALEDWSLKQADRLWETVDQYEMDAWAQWEQMQREPEMFGEFYGYSTSSRIEYTRADDRVVSFQMLGSDYTGGAHGMYAYSGATFDAVAGKQLTIEDLLQEGADFEAFCAEVSEYCIRKLEETYSEYLFTDYAEMVREEMGNLLQGDAWYLNAAGIDLVFNPYMVGPYVMGAVFVTIPYEELEGSLRPEYAAFSRVGAARLPIDTAEELAGPEQPEGSAGLRTAYLLRQKNGREFLIFDMDLASADYVTSVYEIADGEIRKTDETEMGASLNPGYLNAEAVSLYVRMDLLGTYQAQMLYTLGEDGNLEQTGDLYEFRKDMSWGLLTVVRELPVTIEGEETSLPVGTQLRLVAADGEGTAWFETTDGVTGELSYTRGDGENTTWPVYIDGVSETEYFEDLPYAG